MHQAWCWVVEDTEKTTACVCPWWTYTLYPCYRMFLFSIKSAKCFWEQPTFFQFLNQCSQESCLKVWSQDHQHLLGQGACQKCSISNPIPDLMNQWVNEWVLVAQLCLTLCCPMNCNSPGSSVHGILQARVLEWVAISFFRESSRSRDQTQVSRIADSLLSEPPGKPLINEAYA